MRLDVNIADRVGIAQEILAKLAKRELNVSAVEVELPFCFYTNGLETYFWDLGNAPPHKVVGFPTRDDLERFGYHSKREAYDHYLPKALYPFNSINFRNLVPACHHCNSSYKTSKDPAYPVKDPACTVHRRRVFYPYRSNAQKIDIALTVAHADFNALTPAEISISFGPPEIDEELATWRDVYGIDERYRAKIVGKNDGKYWITQAFDEWPAKGRAVEDYLSDLKEQTKACPFADCNFLKKALLEACSNVGLPPTRPANA